MSITTHSKNFWEVVGKSEFSYAKHSYWLKEQGTGHL